jgi:hypothetical protein
MKSDSTAGHKGTQRKPHADAQPQASTERVSTWAPAFTLGA